MTEKEDAQKKIYEYSMYRNQIEAIAQELGAVNNSANNLSMAKLTLDNLKKGSKNSEILVPIGGNSFLIGEIKDPDNVLIGIGSDVVVKKPISDAKTIITEQLDQLDELRGKLEKQIVEINEKMGKLESKVQELAHDVGKKPRKKE